MFAPTLSGAARPGIQDRQAHLPCVVTATQAYSVTSQGVPMSCLAYRLGLKRTAPRPVVLSSSLGGLSGKSSGKKMSNTKMPESYLTQALVLRGVILQLVLRGSCRASHYGSHQVVTLFVASYKYRRLVPDREGSTQAGHFLELWFRLPGSIASDWTCTSRWSLGADPVELALPCMR